MPTDSAKRQQLAERWAAQLNRVIGQGAFGTPIKLTGVRPVSGPRCGAVEMLAGIQSDTLYGSLVKAKRAVLRQTVPWDFAADPVVYFSGRFIRVEAGWPNALAERHVPLSSLLNKPDDRPEAWIVGKNESGATVVMSLTDKTPHVLVAGMTGSGKSTALCNAVFQLSRYPQNEIVLLDGKFGDTLKSVEHMSPYPMALNHRDVRRVLAWALSRIEHRITTGDKSTRTILFFDEYQVFTDDKVITSLLARIAQQGRSGNVHMMLAAQHPTVDSFGGDGSTGRCLPAALVFAVRDHVASRVAVGGPSPRADQLLGEGDGYTVTHSSVHRIQGAWVDRQQFGTRQRTPLEFAIWPEPDWEAIGQDKPSRNRAPQYTETELTHGLLSAMQDPPEGRPAFLARFTGRRPGSVRADKILTLTRKVWGNIQEHLNGEEVDPHPTTVEA